MVTVIESTEAHGERIRVDIHGEGRVILLITTDGYPSAPECGWYVTLNADERNALAEVLFTE